jgi:ferric-dicitrate binding protein FerR (iron transport regulator)
MDKKLKVFALASAIGLGILATGCGASAPPVARLLSFSGDVTAQSTASSEFIKVQPDQQLVSGSAVKTAEEGRAQLELLNDKSAISLGGNTFLEIKNYSEKELKQISGIAIYKISPQNRELKIQTPQGMATVLGTVFRVDASAEQTTVTVEEGTVGFKKDGAPQIIITAGTQYSTSFSENAAKSIDPLEREQLFNPDTELKPTLNPR